MDVIIFPPKTSGIPGGYVIAQFPYAPGYSKFATPDGNWADDEWGAIAFTSAKYAIEFAEKHGWRVVNKVSSDRIIESL